MNSSMDAVLHTPDYVEFATMPPDAIIPDGVALVETTLYVDREARGQILGVNSLLSGGHRIDYFTTA
jgi:hypothetical protein